MPPSRRQTRPSPTAGKVGSNLTRRRALAAERYLSLQKLRVRYTALKTCPARPPPRSTQSYPMTTHPKIPRLIPSTHIHTLLCIFASDHTSFASPVFAHWIFTISFTTPRELPFINLVAEALLSATASLPSTNVPSSIAGPNHHR